jgi:NDP-sugar pyrophosphorylase family protein
MNIGKVIDEISETQVIVLAGGRAKRMGIDIPKCMLEIGGKKLIDICVESLVKDGFRKFVFLLGHKSEMVIEHVGDGNKYGISGDYSIDPADAIGWGKAKAFKYALINGRINSSRRSIIVFPDDIVSVPNVFLKFLSHHLHYVSKYNVSASTVLVPGTEYPYGVAEVETSGLISDFIEKPLVDKPTSVGIYAFEPNVYDIIRTMIPLTDASPVELESTILPFLAREHKLASFFVPYNSWLPINTVKEFERAAKILAVRP